jgi:hypothetical protein
VLGGNLIHAGLIFEFLHVHPAPWGGALRSYRTRPATHVRVVYYDYDTALGMFIFRMYELLARPI